MNPISSLLSSISTRDNCLFSTWLPQVTFEIQVYPSKCPPLTSLLFIKIKHTTTHPQHYIYNENVSSASPQRQSSDIFKKVKRSIGNY